jgi:protein SCO1/2
METRRKRRFAPFAAALLTLSTAALAAPERTLLASPPQALSDFELTSHEDKPVRLAQLRGAPVLLFFGFTHCPSVCPAALEQLRQLEKQHGKELGRARIVIVSVDGGRDTPERLASWLKPISKNFLGLTGEPEKVRRIASELTAAFYKTPGRKPSEYLVEHNSQIFLIDGSGKLRATFFNAPISTIAEVTSSIAGGRRNERTVQ